jgi:MerR family transcriptional regulator, redox-sensitive transcriptional activator SoxR
MDTESFDWHEAGLAVGQVAERSGVAPSALRFYERQGMITSDRTAGNQRRYHGDVLCCSAAVSLGLLFTRRGTGAGGRRPGALRRPRRQARRGRPRG